MAVLPQEERKAFEQFIRAVKERYRPERVLLFGSQARQVSSPESDYDLLIVSSKFEGVRLTDRATAIYRMWPLWADLDCLCLTPAEFELSRQRISIVREIDREGLLL